MMIAQIDPLRACVSEESDSSCKARWTPYHIPEELMAERSRDGLGVCRVRGYAVNHSASTDMPSKRAE